MSRTLMPCAYRLMIMSSRPPEIRPDRLGTSSGSKLPVRSRGTSSGTGPIPVCTCLLIVPLRELPEWWPAGSRRPYPRCAVSSASSARSSTALTSSPSMDPSPVSRSPPASSLDRSSSASSSRSSISSRKGASCRRTGCQPPAHPCSARLSTPVAGCDLEQDPLGFASLAARRNGCLRIVHILRHHHRVPPTLQRQRDAAGKGQLGRQKIFGGLPERLDDHAS